MVLIMPESTNWKMPIKDILSGTNEEVAKKLLGSKLIRTINGQKLVCKIVEVELYEQKDAASHSYRGKTQRNSVMFGPGGRAYVYFTYGMHYCLNIVIGEKDQGSAVLIRAVEPLEGLEIMSRNRGGKVGTELSNGPAKLCYALSINKNLNGHDLSKPPLELLMSRRLKENEIVVAKRIGITRETNRLLRWYIKDNQFVSRP